DLAAGHRLSTPGLLLPGGCRADRRERAAFGERQAPDPRGERPADVPPHRVRLCADGPRLTARPDVHRTVTPTRRWRAIDQIHVNHRPFASSAKNSRYDSKE